MLPVTCLEYISIAGEEILLAGVFKTLRYQGQRVIWVYRGGSEAEGLFGGWAASVRSGGSALQSSARDQATASW